MSQCTYRCKERISGINPYLLSCFFFFGVGECGGSTLFATALHTLGKLAYKLLGEISYLHSHLTLGVLGLKMCTSTSGFYTGSQNLNWSHQVSCPRISGHASLLLDRWQRISFLGFPLLRNRLSLPFVDWWIPCLLCGMHCLHSRFT